MWSTDTLWFEVAIVSSTFAFGHILFGHFEERTPRARKLLKFLFTLALVLGLSYIFGRKVALIVYGMLFIPVIYIHAFFLPRKGINGWTGKPRSKYYAFRKWDMDIFKDD